jgi:hypothetical protein
MTTPYLHLKGFVDGNSQLIDILEENLLEFFNWGLLEAGAYDDVRIFGLGSGTSPYNAPENLSPVSVPGVTAGRVWQAPYRNWAYESGLESTRQPIVVSGVYVDGLFKPLSGSGQYEHDVDYTNGRIEFTNAIPITSVVQAEYSYKRVNLYDQDVPWFHTVVFDSFGPEQSTKTVPSGAIGLMRQHEFQLPFILVESVSRQRQVPRELGSISHWVYQDFLFHVVAENSMDRNNLVDLICRQKHKSFYLFDTNARAADNAYALDYDNRLVPNKPLYPTLVSLSPSGYRMNEARFYETVGSESSARIPLFRGVVRVTLEVGLV